MPRLALVPILEVVYPVSIRNHYTLHSLAAALLRKAPLPASLGQKVGRIIPEGDFHPLPGTLD